MKHFLNQLSVGKKLLVLAVFFAVCLLAIVSYTVITLHQQSADALVINQAGRQRMLTQKFSKELFDELASQSGQYQASTKTLKLFDITLKALRFGGKGFADLAMKKPITLPPNKDREIAKQLEKVYQNWQKLKASVVQVKQLPKESEAWQQHYQVIKTQNIKTLKSMNKAVGMLAANSAGKVSSMITIEWILLVLIMAIGAFITLLISKAIVDPLGKIVAITARIAKGDLTFNKEDLRIDSRDEIGQLAASFLNMIHVLDNLSTELGKVSSAAKRGKLDVRCQHALFTGSWKELTQGVNQIVDQFVKPLENATWYLDHISHGDIPEAITEDYPGDFQKIKDSVNRCIDTINRIVSETDQLIQSAHQGVLQTNTNLEAFEGKWRDIISGLEQLFITIAQPIQSTRHVMERVARGELNETMTGHFQGEFLDLKNSVNSTIEQLKTTISDIQSASNIILEASNDVVSGNNSLSARTENQASSLEETAASIEQLTGTISNTAANAQKAESLAKTSQENANEGGIIVHQAIDAMSAISESSNKIRQIIGVIDEIAFQTNLLALNASVEAARAGEQGRGFAVVATEVRTLAGRSASAAKEIRDLIQDSVNRVETGSELVNQSGETLDTITKSIEELVEIFSEITVATREQSMGLNQINQAVAEIDDITQQNAALAEQTSAATASMKDQAIAMSQKLSFFKLS